VNNIIEKAKRSYILSQVQAVKTCKDLFSITDNLLGKQKTSRLPSGSPNDLCVKFSNFFNDKIHKNRNVLDFQ
jgi:hypothetical protein